MSGNPYESVGLECREKILDGVLFFLKSVPEAPANKTHKILASVVAAHGLFGGFTAQKRIAKQQRDKQLWHISVF